MPRPEGLVGSFANLRQTIKVKRNRFLHFSPSSSAANYIINGAFRFSIGARTPVEKGLERAAATGPYRFFDWRFWVALQALFTSPTGSICRTLIAPLGNGIFPVTFRGFVRIRRVGSAHRFLCVFHALSQRNEILV